MQRANRLMKLAGAAGFAFFFVKGMVWLAVFAAAAVGLLGR